MENYGNYERIRKLGQGTYGTVYLCRQVAHASPIPTAQLPDPQRYDRSRLLFPQISSGKLCVMKRILMSSLNQKELRSAKKEAELLEELSHPNVVGFMDTHCSKTKLYLFMQAHLHAKPSSRARLLCQKLILPLRVQYCDGGDLEQRIAKTKKEGALISEHQLLDWFVQMSLALSYLHSKPDCDPALDELAEAMLKKDSRRRATLAELLAAQADNRA
ncbi:MAG: hypothetical protein SGPRY_001586 [Prymnesium sp.]